MASTNLTTSLVFRLIDRVTGPIKSMIRGIKGVEKEGKKAGDAFKLAADMKHAADGVRDFSNQAANLIKKPIAVFTDFEEQMSKVKALTFKGAKSEENKRLFAELAAKARQLGADTQFSGMEAAQGMTLLATAGFSAKEQMKSMGGVLDIAAASGSSLATTAEISSATLRGFRLEAEEMSRVGDVLVNTFSSSQTTLESLGEAMKYIAPVAASAGVSLEKSAAMVGVLGDVGIQGSQAGTSIRAMLLKLQAPDKKGKSALQFLGINPKDKTGNLKPVDEILAQIQQRMDKKFGVGKGGTRRAALLKGLFGEEPIAGVQALLDASGSGKLKERITGNEGAAGTANKVALEMVDNTAGAGKELDSAVEELHMTVGEVLIPTVVDLLKLIREVTIGFTAWAKEYPNLVKYGGLLVASVAAIGFAVVAGIKVVSTAITIWGALQKAWLATVAISKVVVVAMKLMKLAALSNPITAIIVGLATAALLIYEYWDPISEFFTGLWSGIKDVFASTIDWITGKIEWAGNKLADIRDSLLMKDNAGAIAAGETTAAELRRSSSLFRDDEDSVHARVINKEMASAGLGSSMVSGLTDTVGRIAANARPVITDEQRSFLNSLSSSGAPAANGAPIAGDDVSPSRFSGELKITVNGSGQVEKQELKTKGDPGFRVRANVGRQA